VSLTSNQLHDKLAEPMADGDTIFRIRRDNTLTHVDNWRNGFGVQFVKGRVIGLGLGKIKHAGCHSIASQKIQAHS
jgi:hypothetical protein